MGATPNLREDRFDLALKLAIFGSGFGAYGYLPAACSLGWSVVMPERSRQAVEARSELRGCLSRVDFLPTDADTLDSASCVVVARDPRSQFEFVSSTSETLASKKHVFLEKPLAESLRRSKELLSLLEERQVPFSVAYLFTRTGWFRQLQSAWAAGGRNVEIVWKIPRVESSWKNSSEFGGGLAHFYLVHFMPVLMELGIDQEKCSVWISMDRFLLEYEGFNRLLIRAQVFETIPEFRVDAGTQSPMFLGVTPLGERPQAGEVDPRVPLIASYLAGALEGTLSTLDPIIVEREVLRFRARCDAVLGEHWRPD